MEQALTPGDIPRLFVEAWNERNARAIADLFFEEAEFVNVVGLWWHTREEIYKAHDYGLRKIFNNSHLSVTKIQTKYLTDDIAVVNARMHLKGQTSVKDGKQPESRYNIFTFVVKKTENGWRCAAAHNTDMVPGAETNVVKDGRIRGASYRED